VSIAKTGPASANAGFDATYPLTVTNSGGAARRSCLCPMRCPTARQHGVRGTGDAGRRRVRDAVRGVRDPGQTPAAR